MSRGGLEGCQVEDGYQLLSTLDMSPTRESHSHLEDRIQGPVRMGPHNAMGRREG